MQRKASASSRVSSTLTRTLIEFVIIVPVCLLVGYGLVLAAGVVFEGIGQALEHQRMKHDGDTMIRLFALFALLIAGVWSPILVLAILETSLVGDFSLDAIMPTSVRNVVAALPQYLVLAAGWCAILAGIAWALRPG